MRMAAFAIPVDHRPARIGTSGRQRAMLLLIALLFHLALLSLVRSNRLMLQDPAANSGWIVTATLQPPTPPAPAAAALPTTAPAKARNENAARRVQPTAQAKAPSSNAQPLDQPAAPQIELKPDPNNEASIDGQLDVENLERQAVLIAQDRNVTFEMPRDRLVHAPTANERLAEAVNKSERKDCRSAYAGLGPLALPFLIENTVTGTGCKW
jgi:hypothetical protein